MTTASIKTVRDLCASTNIPSSLVRAVVRQMGGWESFKQSACDVASHGIDGGFHGFIYNRDTEAFAKKHRKDIAAMASEQAQELGFESPFAMIRGFGCFRNGTKPTDEEIGMALYAGKEPDNSVPVLNALAWYAGEEVCRAYADSLDR